MATIEDKPQNSARVTSYVYNWRDELTQESATLNGTNQPLLAASYTYDANGSLKTLSNGTAFHYDRTGHQDNIRVGGYYTDFYIYDADGNMV